MRHADVSDAGILARAIVNTVREPLLVLDEDLRVVAASRSFYSTFQSTREETEQRLLYTLGDGQWDIPSLRALLEKVLPEHTSMEEYEVDHMFPDIGRRIMLLNARQVVYGNAETKTLLLAIEDITARRSSERVLNDLLEQKELLLEEMQHRIANSLQIIASILMLKARAVVSEETRNHLQDAHNRVLSVAIVQKHLVPSGRVELIEIAPYLRTLCASLANSMVSDSRPVAIETSGSVGATVKSAVAVSIGLIVTECVINSLKHAFGAGRPDGKIVVSYEVDDQGWRLSIADNGVGKVSAAPNSGSHGLGTSIVSALAQQLNAEIKTRSDLGGTKVMLTYHAIAAVPKVA